ncbi:hypothetical protein SC171_02925 [Pantoea cypripedii]|uniref:hypothetical protein n=1 Tax=Pantoea cypripedii TaxID=55209 RepID=UPI002FC9D1A3
MLSTSIESCRKSAISTLHQHNTEITKKLPTITHVSNRGLQSGHPHTTTLMSNRSTHLGLKPNTLVSNRPLFQSLRYDQGKVSKRPMPKLFVETLSEPAQKVKNLSGHGESTTVSSILKNTARKSVIKKSIASPGKKTDSVATGLTPDQIKKITLQNIRTEGYWNNNAMDLAVYGIAGSLDTRLYIEDHTCRGEAIQYCSISQTPDPQTTIRLRRVWQDGQEHYQFIDNGNQVHNVINDGNCLFRAIALARNNDESNYLEYRNRASHYIEENWDNYKDTAIIEDIDIMPENQKSEYYAQNKRFISLWESIKTVAEKKHMDWSKLHNSENNLIRILSGKIANPEKILTNLNNRDLQNLSYASRGLNKVTENFIARKQESEDNGLRTLNNIPCTAKDGSEVRMDLELLAKFDERVSFIDSEGLEGAGELIYFNKHADDWYAMVHEAQKIIMWQGNYLPRQLTSKLHTDYPINPRDLFITNFPLDNLYELADEGSGDDHREWYNTVLQQNLAFFKFLDEHYPE